MQKPKTLLSRRQTAQRAGVDVGTVDLWVSKGFLPTVPVNEIGWYRIPSAALDRFLTEGPSLKPVAAEHSA